MSSAILVPDSTVTNTGALTGGASAHAVLLDLNDATYVTLDPTEVVEVGFTNPSLPAGAVVTRVDVLLRVAAAVGDAPGLLITLLTVDGEDDQRTAYINSAVFRQWTAASVSGSNDPDTTTVRLQAALDAIVVSLSWATVYYVEQPVVDVTAPTGTLTNDNQPTVTWTNTLDADGGAQFAATVRVFDEATYTDGGFDPDTSDAIAETSFFGAATSWQMPAILENGDYRAYVQVAQLVNTSDWEYEAFTVDVPLPAQPTFLLDGEPDHGRTKIELAANSGEATTDGAQVQVRIDGEWRDVRTPDGDGRVAFTTTGTLYDFEAPNRLTRYRARSYAEDTGSFAYSSWVEAEVARGSTKWFFKHPTQWIYNVGCDLRSFPGHSRESNQTIHRPLGSSTAIAIGDGTRGPETGTVVIRSPDDVALGLVQRLASLGATVLMQPPSDHHERDRWVVLGTETAERLIDKAWSDERDIAYEWTEVTRPDGNLAEGDPGGLYPSDYLYPSDDLYPS